MEPEVKSEEANKKEPELPSLFIQLMPDRSVMVKGPINDKMLSYALLESARDAIKDHFDIGTKVTVAPHNGNFLNYIRGLKRH